MTLEWRELCVLVLHSAWTDIYLFSTTFIGPVAFEGRELCVLVIQSARTDSYLFCTNLIGPVPCVLALNSGRPGNYLSCTTFIGRVLYVLVWQSDRIDSYLFSTNLIDPVSFEGRELYLLVLHSVGWDSYCTLLWYIIVIIRKNPGLIFTVCFCDLQTNHVLLNAGSVTGHECSYFNWTQGVEWRVSRRDQQCATNDFKMNNNE